jgi:hypothetical protein
MEIEGACGDCALADGWRDLGQRFAKLHSGDYLPDPKGPQGFLVTGNAGLDFTVVPKDPRAGKSLLDPADGILGPDHTLLTVAGELWASALAVEVIETLADIPRSFASVGMVMRVG